MELALHAANVNMKVYDRLQFLQAENKKQREANESLCKKNAQLQEENDILTREQDNLRSQNFKLQDTLVDKVFELNSCMYLFRL